MSKIENSKNSSKTNLTSKIQSNRTSLDYERPPNKWGAIWMALSFIGLTVLIIYLEMKK